MPTPSSLPPAPASRNAPRCFSGTLVHKCTQHRKSVLSNERCFCATLLPLCARHRRLARRQGGRTSCPRCPRSHKSLVGVPGLAVSGARQTPRLVHGLGQMAPTPATSTVVPLAVVCFMIGSQSEWSLSTSPHAVPYPAPPPPHQGHHHPPSRLPSCFSICLKVAARCCGSLLSCNVSSIHGAACFCVHLFHPAFTAMLGEARTSW